MKRREALELLLELTEKVKGKKYELSLEKYTNHIYWYGTHSDEPLDEETRIDSVACIKAKDLKIEDIYYGAFNYPGEYSSFYQKGSFILLKKFYSYDEEEYNDFLNEDIEWNDVLNYPGLSYIVADEYISIMESKYDKPKTKKR